MQIYTGNIELKNPCAGCSSSDEIGGPCSSRGSCTEYAAAQARIELLSQLTPVAGGEMTPEEICKIECGEKPAWEKCAYRAINIEQCKSFTDIKLGAAVQYAKDLADRQKEREKIVAEIWEVSIEKPGGIFLTEEAWQSLKSKILKGELNHE